jgi:hypothetical protein
MLLRSAALLKTEMVDCESRRMDHGSMSRELLCVIITTDCRSEAATVTAPVVTGGEAASTEPLACANVMAAGGGAGETVGVAASARLGSGLGADSLSLGLFGRRSIGVE